MKGSTLSTCLLVSFFVSRTEAFQSRFPKKHGGSRSFSSLPLFVTPSETTTPPKDEVSHTLSIEYCTGCRWMLKSFWMAQELLTTFQDDLDAVVILPSSNQGIFAVRLDGNHLLWDRKEQGGFPSPKGLKQLVRDMVEPEKFLGHSDTAERQSAIPGEAVGSLLQGGKAAAAEGSSEVHPTIDRELPDAPQPAVTITYCTGCRWLLRAAYFGQELLTTFGDEIKSVTLVPSKPPSKGGVFSIGLNGELLFDRATEGRFPEVKEIKQMIRDRITPEKDLGHSDVKDVERVMEETLDEDEAAEARRFFGVD